MSILNLPDPSIVSFTLEVIPLSMGSVDVPHYFQRVTSMQGVWVREFNYGAYGSWLTVGGGGGAAGLIEVRTVTADYTLTSTDIKDLTIRVASAASVTITLPTDATVSLPIGASVLISRNGIGQVFIAGELGVTVDTPETYEINKMYGKVVALKTGIDHWEIEGNLVPSL